MAESSRNTLVLDSQKFDNTVGVLPTSITLKISSCPDFPQGLTARIEAERMKFPKGRFYTVRPETAQVLFNMPYPTLPVREYPFSRSSHEYKEFRDLVERVVMSFLSPYVAAKGDYADERPIRHATPAAEAEASIFRPSPDEVTRIFAVRSYGDRLYSFVEYQGAVYKASDIGRGLSEEELLKLLRKLATESTAPRSFLILGGDVYQFFCQRRTLGFDYKRKTIYATEKWGFKTLLDLKAVFPEANIGDIVEPADDIKGRVGYIPYRQGDCIRITQACTQRRYRDLVAKVTQDQDSCFVKTKVLFPWGYKLPELYYTGLERLRAVPDSLMNTPKFSREEYE